MVQVEEIELDLGLSIGGTFTKLTMEKPLPDSKPENLRFDSDPRDEMQRGSVVVDPHEKREMQALRRMEAKKKRERKRERVREPQPEWQRVFKREKTECLNGTWTAPFRVHQFATVQYLPLSNGFPLPCWVGSEKNVGGLDGVNVGDRKTKSNGSSMCSSSAVSDYQSSSPEDGGSTDSRSHSVHSLAEPTQLNTSREINIRTQPEESASASSHPMRSKQGNDNVQQERKHIVKELQQEPMKLKEEAATRSNNALAMPIEKPLFNENSSNGFLKETKVDMGKPPKPVSQTSSLPQMPYVSAKGNGPNGTTVHGFLYRYTKSEVIIVCVCHGSTFSPAEFVQHAGGTDISHPLRHITVIPSVFG